MDIDSSSSSSEEGPPERGRFSILNAKGRQRRKDSDDTWQRHRTRTQEDLAEVLSQAHISLPELMRMVAAKFSGARGNSGLQSQPSALRNLTLKPYQMEVLHASSLIP